MFKLNIGIICAAGMGTRVRGILGDRTSKEMVHAWGKPALQHHLDLMLRLRGFNDIVVVTNSKKRDIIDYMFENFNQPEHRRLIKDTNVVGHTVFTHTIPTSWVSVQNEHNEDRTLVEVDKPKKVRVHLVVMAHDKIGQNPIESMSAAYNLLGRGEFFNTNAFISFADIVIENMAEELSYTINEHTVSGINYISALSRKSEQDTLRIENCGRFSIESPAGGSLDLNDLQVKNLTSVLSKTDNVDTCTHMDLGFYYGSTRTLFRTAGTWVYDRMSTSLLPIRPLLINQKRKAIDFGDPQTYIRNLDWKPERSVQHISMKVEISQ